MPFVSNKNVKIFFEEIGEGPNLTILGGLGDSLRNWTFLINKLKSDFKILYIQNRGSGQSDRPQHDYTIADMCHDTFAVIDHLGLEKINLLGFSMGGRIAQQFAILHPTHLKKLILVSTAATWDYRYPPKDFVRETLEEFTGSDADFVKIYEILYGPDYRNRFSPQAFVKFRQSDPYPQTLQDFRLQWEAIKKFDIRDQLSQIQAPTLILAGEKDEMTPSQNALWLHSLLPNAEVKVYPQAGHIVQIENQKEFLADLKSFLLG